MIPDASDRPRPPPTLAAVAAQAMTVGLSIRGAFHPSAGTAQFLLDVAPGTATCVLLGFTGGAQWAHFAASAEAADGAPDPLDRWSRRLIGALAREYGAFELYPSGQPQVRFQRLAVNAESVHPSPIGLLIHPRWGLWHAYRGALLFHERIELPAVEARASPCTSCSVRPCLFACPVNAFGTDGFNFAACATHVASVEGSDCRERGCRARRACPVGTKYIYPAGQMQFHMDAFIRSVTR